jgi:hypothetical protein
MPEDDLINLVTRGFAGIHDQLRERDDKVARVAENMIRMEGEVKAMTATLNRLDGEMSKAESESLKVRMGAVEQAVKDIRAAQESSALWIRGLLVSVIFLLVGVLFNFLNARLK